MFSDIYDVGSNSTKRLLTDHLKQRFKNWIRQFCEAKKFEGLLSFDFIRLVVLHDTKQNIS